MRWRFPFAVNTIRSSGENSSDRVTDVLRDDMISPRCGAIVASPPTAVILGSSCEPKPELLLAHELSSVDTCLADMLTTLVIGRLL
jgi:hypothetical protein